MNTKTTKGQSLKYFILGSIISADNDKYTEDVKQEIIQRMKKDPENWSYILEPLGEHANKYIELIESANNE